MMSVVGVTWLSVWLSVLSGVVIGRNNFCAYYDSAPSDTVKSNVKNGEVSDVTTLGGEVMLDNRTIRCVDDNNFCYTLWTVNVTSDKENIIKQGCWIGEQNQCFDKSCRSNTPPKPVSESVYSKFCCCSGGERCNENVTDVYKPDMHTSEAPPTPLRPTPDPTYREKTIIISLVSVCSVALLILIVYLIYRMFVTNKRVIHDPLQHIEAQPPPGFEIDDLKMCSIISKGRYSEVWKGLLNDLEVAVKIYTPHYRQYYQNEGNIYRLPFMEHDNLLKFYGADERLSQDGLMQYLLVLEYVPVGSLTNYLKNNTLDWPTLCKMAYSVCRGLAHMHTDITKGDKFKPAVAHRDINSRNILVKGDLTCVIADLGFCMPIMGSKLIKNGHAENAEQSTLTDVGTIRYMAPELLDGAVNLRDCEASLKQIDIYSIGLVLWEIAMRCTDLYQGAPVPEYMLPYQAEAGPHPSFEDMQLLVTRRKRRPRFPEVWKDTNQAVRCLKETIEDCWDPDAEARLTALCVEERISDLMTTWAQDTKHRGMTPTINPTVNITSQSYLGKSSQGLNHDQTHNVDLYAANMVDYRSSVSSPTENSSAPLLGNGVVRNGEIPNYSQNHRSWYQDRSVSASTTETVVPVTPSESDPPPKSNNITIARNNIILQPHQGRNPTVARNTHKRSDEELAVSGNTLLGPGMDVASVNQLSENTYDSVGDNLETSLVQNDALNQHRNPPIPYLQNQVQVPAVRPKVANVPGNGVPYRHLNEGKSLREKIGKFIKPKELGLKLSSWNFFGLKSNTRNQSSINLEPDQGQSNHSVNEDSSGLLNQANTLPKTVVQPVQTEICLQNGHAFVRPSNLALQEMPLAHRQSEAAGSSSEGRYPENRLGFAEVGVAKLKNSNVGQQSVVRLKGTGQSKSTSDLSPAHTGKSRWQETKLFDITDGQKRRPTSLSLRGHNYASQPNPYVVVGPTSMGSSAPNVALKPPDENSDPSEKIKKRIKTPVNMKKGRFSLYDDRLMCQGMDECVQNNTGNGLKKTSLSLHQLKQSDIIEVTGSQPQLV
ncbi:bone morphogenetic protein receptor type-2-like [Haliotis asinina]|uniref:bone morphogenetic protein receptor type-2-like n=1 Tax=Haliotis asinina TaxID=109174 RepID=UPI0035325186